MTKVKSVNRIAGVVPAGKNGNSNGNGHAPKVEAPKPVEPAKPAWDRSALVQAFKDASGAITDLGDVIRESVKLGATSDDITACAIEAGYSESYARQVIVMAKDELFPGREKKATGRKVDKSAQALADYAIAKYGSAKIAASKLLAASRICTKLAKVK